MKPPKPVVAVQHGNNSDLIAAAAKLYIRDGDRVADVTYGKGLFWKKTNTNRFTLLASDLQPRAHEAIPMDFRALAYADASLDHVILDPPYIHRPSPFYEQLYANQATTPDISHAEIIALYRAGMSEAVRALRRGGLLWAKGKDEIENGRQCWAHVELHTIAQELGMTAIDKLYLQTGLRMLDRRPTQRHSRRNVSFLWVFKKVRKSEAA
jgi:hypothetical protein